jgi:hypothetical protein
MEQLKKLQHLSLVSKVTAELENHLNIADKTLAEFVIELAKDQKNVDAFKKVRRRRWGMPAATVRMPELLRHPLLAIAQRCPCRRGCRARTRLSTSRVRPPPSQNPLAKLQALAELGSAMPDALVERLWSIIQHMMGGGAAPGGAGGGLARAKVRPDAAVPALGIEDTRDMAKQLTDELLAEARAKGGHVDGPSTSGRPAEDVGRWGLCPGPWLHACLGASSRPLHQACCK